jgi:hypothetical protein
MQAEGCTCDVSIWLVFISAERRMFTTIAVVFLVANACYWGLAGHGMHCSLLPDGVACPPHYVHLLMGLGFFIAAIVVAQWDYIKYLAGVQ